MMMRADSNIHLTVLQVFASLVAEDVIPFKHEINMLFERKFNGFRRHIKSATADLQQGVNKLFKCYNRS